MQPFYFCNTSRVFFGEGAVAEHRRDSWGVGGSPA